MALYTIPCGLSFLEVFVEGVIADYAHDPLLLSKTHIFLPSKRAVRLATQMFGRKMGAESFFLPKLIPLGEVALDLVELGEEPDFSGKMLPEAISPLRRQFILAHLAFAWGKTQNIGLHTLEQAFPFAQSLANFLDQLQSEAIPLIQLKTLVPEHYAKHWQVTLDFLKILSDHWPVILAENQKLDPIERRNLVFEDLISSLRHSNPKTPILIAGSTGTFPKTAELMREVLSLQQGHVILPGLDLNMTDSEWIQVLEKPIHPQHQLSRLCSRNGWQRDKILTWHSCPKTTPQSHFLSGLFGQSQPLTDSAFLKDVSLIPCKNLFEEADLIAMILRESIALKKETVLIVADRDLVNLVKLSLSRWGIEIDDSHGSALRTTSSAVFFGLLLEIIQKDWSPIPLLALLKHSFLKEKYEDLTLELEALFRKSYRPKPLELLENMSPLGVQLFQEIQSAFRKLADLFQEKEISFSKLLEAHIQLAETLAGKMMWKREESEAFSGFLTTLLQETEGLPLMSPLSYAHIFEQMLRNEVYRPLRSHFPFLSIWGTIEARLESKERVILGGLNEGFWPPETKADPWLNKKMREDLGLPLLERRIGLSAHDFCQAFGAKEVIMTRSERLQSGPSCAAHWLIKLQNYLDHLGLKGALVPKKDWLSWIKENNRPKQHIQLKEPRPTPPFSARPRELSATQIETLLRNPYAIYARHILKLKELTPIDQEPHQAHFGTLLHKILELFQKNVKGILEEKEKVHLYAIGKAELEKLNLRPDLLFFWEPNLMSMLDWFFEQEQKRRPYLKQSFLEQKGKAILRLEKGLFTLKAVADRIDLYNNLDYEIIDYKTGQLPRLLDMRLGFSAQLFIEAVIAVKGGFPLGGILPSEKSLKLSLWRLKGKSDKAEIRHVKEDLELLLPEVMQNLISVLEHYDDPCTPYIVHPHPLKAPAYDAYRHLSRIDEWGAQCV